MEEAYFEQLKVFEEEFMALKLELDKPISNNISYEQNDIKYKGNKMNDLYEGRGILCDKNDKIIFNGYFKKGKYDGFGRLYDNENLIY